MSADYEYTVVELPDGAFKTREQDTTVLLNKVAAHGWRLVTVEGQPGQHGSRTYAYFERRAQNDG